jgi:hypothetical protein
MIPKQLSNVRADKEPNVERTGAPEILKRITGMFRMLAGRHWSVASKKPPGSVGGHVSSVFSSIRLTSQFSSRTPMAPYRELNKYEAYDAGQVGEILHRRHSCRGARAIPAYTIVPKIRCHCQPPLTVQDHESISNETSVSAPSRPAEPLFGIRPGCRSADGCRWLERCRWARGAKRAKINCVRISWLSG